jgi:flagellar motor switch protein FliG
MRTDPARPRPTLERLRAPIESLARRLAALGPRARWLAASAALAALAAVGYHFAAAEPVGYEWLNAKAFAATEANQVLAVLREAEIPCEERSGRISVPADRKAEALAALARAKLGPRRFDEILDEYANGGSILDPPDAKKAREIRGTEVFLQESIRKMIGIQAANVSLTPIPGGTRLRPVQRLRALVYVQAEGSHLLPDKTVGLILTVLEGKGIEPEDVILVDLWSNHEYWVGGQPEVAARSAARVREEELRDRIDDALHIEGAKVIVRIDPPPSPPPAPAEPPAATPLAVNRPIGEPSVDEPTTPAPAAPAEAAKVSVMVRIPHSYYLRAAVEHHPGREPTIDALQREAASTGESVRKIVATLLAPSEQARVDIERYEDLHAARPPAPAGESDARRAALVWGPIAAGAVLAVFALGGLLAARRPSARPDRSPRRDAFEAGDHDGPGQRVRTLIRRDPAAAAGVLHRWIAQGGRPEVDPLRKAAILIVSLEESLARQLLAGLDRADVDAVSLEMARLDRIDPAEQLAVLEDFYAQAIRRLRFVFEDIVRMDDREIRAAYDDEDAPAWSLALSGASRPVRAKVLGALAAPAAEALRRALATLGPVRLDDVESAQADLAERLRRLHDQGRITLPDPDGQEEILV